MAKIKHIEKKNGRYDLAELPEKINEIIDVLNSSFITLDPDTSVDVLDSLTTVTSIQCDKLTPFSNETINIQEHYDNCVWKPKGLYDNIMCPKCHKKHFTVGESTCTLAYHQPVYKDGVNINPNHNICTTKYTCCECGHTWEE